MFSLVFFHSRTVQKKRGRQARPLKTSDSNVLQEYVVMSEQSTLATSSQGQYADKNKAFLLWLWKSDAHRHLLNMGWIRELCLESHARVPQAGGAFGTPTERLMKTRLLFRVADATAPVVYDVALCDAWLLFVHALDVSFSTLGGYRSAFGHLWGNFHVSEEASLPESWNIRISTVFKGLARTKAKEKERGTHGRVEKGKRALEFRTYNMLCERAWGGGGGNVGSPFMVLYITLSWNLMSRNKNVTNITFPHFELEGRLFDHYVLCHKDESSWQKYSSASCVCKSREAFHLSRFGVGCVPVDQLIFGVGALVISRKEPIPAILEKASETY